MEKKTYKILKTVPGSHDGLTVQTFNKDEIHEIGPDLAEQLYHQGAIEEVTGKANPAEKREMKVSGPAETKVTAPSETKEGELGVDSSTQHIEELNTVARDNLGQDTDTKMSRAELKEVVDGKSKPAKTKK